jgi:nicotinate-nucleotide pyrophosphorylase (carboxylating)
VARLISASLSEDIGPGDVTSEAIVPKNLEASAELFAKEDGVLAGLPLARLAFERLSRNVRFTVRKRDGAAVRKGDVIATLRGPARAILAGERVSLNFLQRLSGIATTTRRYVEAVKGYKVAIMDTRKTTPGWRELEKYAVRVGGGQNHRIGLHDMALIKDNHIEVARTRWGDEDAIGQAVAACRRRYPKLAVEVEAQDMNQVREAVLAEPDIIMLDNMPPDRLRKAVELIRRLSRALDRKPPLTEASGGITLDTVRAVAATGVDRISIGALTHSVKALDICLTIRAH